MIENITINIWMILAVILSIGMIAILVFSIYRGINRCNLRIDNQGGSLQRIDSRIDNINNEITNIKIDQANVKAIQLIKDEDSKKQPAPAPIHIYQQAPPQQYPYTPAQLAPSIPQTQVYPYMQQAPQQQQPQQQVQPQAPQQEPVAQYYAPETVEIRRQQSIPQEEQPQVQYPRPELVKPEKPEPVLQQESQRVQQKKSQSTSQQEPQIAPQRAQDTAGIKAPIYHQTRMPEVGFTEFQLPEECDFDEDNTYMQRPEAVVDIRREARPETRPAIRLEKEPKADTITENRPQSRPTIIPTNENIVPSKFNSLNDGISRTGKRYSEAEIANRILD